MLFKNIQEIKDFNKDSYALRSLLVLPYFDIKAIMYYKAFFIEKERHNNNILVYTKDDFFNYLEFLNVDNVIYINIHTEDQDTNKEFRKNSLLYLSVNIYNFFTPEFIKFLNDFKFENQSKRPKIVLCYSGISLTVFFILCKYLDLNFSTGFNKYKGILNTQELLLSKILIVLYGKNADDIINYNLRKNPLVSHMTKSNVSFIEDNIKPAIGNFNTKDICSLINSEKRSVLFKNPIRSYHTSIRNNRLYSTVINSLEAENIIFNNLENILRTKSINKDTQIDIEKFLYNQCQYILKEVNVLDVNVSLLNVNINKYCFEKSEYIKIYLDKLQKQLSVNKDINLDFTSTKQQNKLFDHNIFNILETLDHNEIVNDMIYVFLRVLTHQNVSNEDELYCGSTSNNINLGKLIIDKYINTIRDKNITYYKFVEQLKEDKLCVLFDVSFCLRLGSKLSEILIQCDMFIESTAPYKGDAHSIYEITKEVKGFLPENTVIIAPLNLPMIVEPKPYGPGKLGGYLLNEEEYATKLITDKIGLKETSIIAKDNIVYSSINNMMKTAFKVNKDVLYYLIKNNSKHNLLTLDNENIFLDRDINDMKAKEQKEYQKYLSKKLLYEYIINIAQVYRNVPELYFPLKLDNRGRLYPSSSYFHYQSHELAKSLILFARPDFIKRNDEVSINYLKAYGATCFGNGLDKKSYNVRLNWVSDNWEDIVNFNNLKLLNQASNKFLFLSFCFEIKRLNDYMNSDSTNDFSTYLPIQLDGTCNGYQHLALLANEITLYDKLNLDGKGKDKDPSDFYTYMINQMNIHLEDKKNNTKIEEDKKSYDRLINFGLTRSNIKQAIMTKPYNARDFTIANYIKDTLIVDHLESFTDEKTGSQSSRYWYKINEKSTNLVSYNDLYLLSRCINEVIFHDYPHIKALLYYLNQICDIMSNLNLPIVWKLPTGLEVHQQYMKTYKKINKPYTYLNKSFTLTLTDDIKIDKIKQKTALMPNLIHSLDAASLTLLYNNFYKSIDNGVVNFYSVHDCYGVTARYIDVLIAQLRGVYIKLYSKEGYIKTFDDYIIEFILNTYSLEKEAFDKEQRILNINNIKIKFPPIPNITNIGLLIKAYEDLNKANMFIK